MTKFGLFKSMLLLAVLLISTIGVQAQTPFSDYEFEQSNDAPWVSIAGTSLQVATGDDAMATINMPFEFYWDGQLVTEFSVYTNGFLTFNHAGSRWNYETTPGLFGDEHMAIAWMSEDLFCRGGIWAQLDGAPGSQVVTIEWANTDFYFGAMGDDFNAQIKLHESGNAEIIYGPNGQTNYSNWDQADIYFAGNAAGGGQYAPAWVIDPQADGSTIATYRPAGDAAGRADGFQPGTDLGSIPQGKRYAVGVFKPSVTGAYPANSDTETRILQIGNAYSVQDENHPAVLITRKNDALAPITYKYKIAGPMPRTNPDYAVIYTAIQDGVTGYNPGDDEITPNPQPVGINVVEFISNAFGTAADGATLDLTVPGIKGGRYEVLTEGIVDGVSAEGPVQYFQIAMGRDLSIISVVSPKSKDQKKYPASASRIALQATVANLGVAHVHEFDITAKVYDENDVLVHEDLVEYRAPQEVLETGDQVTVDGFSDFRPKAIGDYQVVYEVTLVKAVDPATQQIFAIDQETANNIMPRDGEDYWFVVAHETEAQVDSTYAPKGEYYVGRPIRPAGIFSNQGVADISNIDARCVVTYPDGTTTWETEMVIKDIPFTMPQGVVRRFNELFTPPVAGTYTVCFYLEDPNDPIQTNNEYCSTFEVVEAMSGTYTVGLLNQGLERNYNTIKDAVDALFLYGVTGNVTFELTDALYNEGDINNLEGPALDMSSGIIGASEDRQITFKPARNRSSIRAGVTINLITANGIGVYIAQNEAPSNVNAAVIDVTRSNIKKYANSNGFINFDGGSQKTLKFQLETSADHRSVFYLGQGASDIRIENCLIEGGVKQTASQAADLPLSVFNSAANSFMYEQDVRDDGSTYAAGIVIRSITAYDAKTADKVSKENSNNLDTLTNNNINIIDNEIKGFAFGIVDMGIGVLNDLEEREYIRYYNQNHTIEGNLISDITRAGIFMGSVENSEIKGNRIYNVYSNGTEAAGIMLGGLQERDWYGFNNINIEINANEISNVSASENVYGVRVEQYQMQFPSGSGSFLIFPESDDKFTFTNNVFWGLEAGTASANRAAVRIMTSRDASNNWMTDAIVPAVEEQFVRDILIANNTVVMSDEGLTNTGTTAAYMLQQTEDVVFKNNATLFEDNTFDASAEIAALIYVGQHPKNGALTSDRNAFWFGNSAIDAFRMIETDENSNILEAGFMGQFRNLEQWKVWTNQDANSIIGDFSGDFAYVGADPMNLRFKLMPLPKGSLLENRGDKLEEVERDIDGHLRGEASQRYDIGAFEFTGDMYINDVEVLSMTSPRAYKAVDGLFSDAQYIMTESPVNVKAHVRNNGTLTMADVDMYVKIYIQEADGTFADSAVVEETAKINVSSTESTHVDFLLNDGNGIEFTPKTYSELGDDYTVPAHLEAMRMNVTPLYRIVISAESDENNVNNFMTQDVRFFIKKSKLHLLISAEHASKFIYNGDPTSDEIAGRLNLDTIREGMRRMGWYNRQEEGKDVVDMDIFDRTAWERYAVDYDIYRTLFWADGDDDAITRYERADLDKFLAGGTEVYKRNLVLCSQDIVRELSNEEVFINNDQEFLSTVLRAENVDPGNPMGEGQSYDGNAVIGEAVGLNLRDMIRNTTFTVYEDKAPEVALVNLVQEGDGLSEVAYRYENSLVADQDVMGVATSSIYTTVVYLGVDWRHFANIDRIMRASFDFIEKKGGIVIDVELADFTAKAVGNKAVINWSTAAENGSSHFELEKANVNSAVFETIAKVEAQGQTSSRVDYTPVFDYNVASGNTYQYRLKMVDQDGKFEYSQVREVEFAEAAINLGEITPNPAVSEATIEFTGDEVEVRVYNANGEELSSVAKVVSGRVQLDVRNLASGQYNVIITRDGHTELRMLNVVK